MLPQCAQVNFCFFTLAACQRFSSIVTPVSVNFEVEGQRTSMLLMLGPAFGFGLRGGSNTNRVGISESINDSSFGGVVRRHLHFDAVANCKPNKAFAHLPGNVSENQMVISEGDAKHCSRKHRHDDALQFNRLLSIHAWRFAGRLCETPVFPDPASATV